MDPEQHTSDLRGSSCPTTMLKLLKAVNQSREQIRNGSLELRFLVDSQNSTVIIPEIMGSMGYAAHVEQTEECFRISVRRLQ